MSRRRPRPREPLAGASLSALRDVPLGHLAIRFGFGAAISAIAALVTIEGGPRLGGVFLAFPAILPATLTLIEEQESKRAAVDDDVGAVMGAAALAVFACLIWVLMPRLGAAATLAGAAASWVAAAAALYIVFRSFHARS